MYDRSRSSTSPQPVGRLADDHPAFAQGFADLLRRAHKDDWHELDRRWHRLVEDVADHFAFEESIVFPAFAERGKECRRLVEQLVGEHHEIRRALDDIALQLRIRVVRASTVDALVERLHKHAALENLDAYPWAEAAVTTSRPSAIAGWSAPAARAVSADGSRLSSKQALRGTPS